ncbi:ABC transporter substrate-binding protein [Cumulibacter manganitolerans]|uniref:ABC transporter substrate-binding protein n=1 Tax=Cumulibacter manganitolerans TaxID=1884992 RepID=UPI0012966AB9|nr:ABC transporter substrate-binding protein [Cumulibacter manganitolerans]
MRRRPRLFTTAISVMLLAAACGDIEKKDPGAATKDIESSIPLAKGADPNGHFDWAWSTPVTHWDPTHSVTGGDLNFYNPVYDRLLRMKPDGSIVAMLAEKWEPGDDGKSLTMTIKKGLSFTDGTPFTADAVKFNLDRAAQKGSTIAGEVEQISSVEVIDDHTVKINVDNALGALISALAVRPGIMVSPTAVQSGSVASIPVGIGPYTVTESIPGDKVSYAKTPGYWDPDAQRVATMTYFGITDDQTRLNALESGEIDGAYLNPSFVDSAKKAGLNVISAPTSTFVYFMLNEAVEPYDDPKVRKAVNLAIDREGIAKGLYEGFCTPEIQPWPSTSFAYNKDIGDGSDKWGYDPDEAKKLMKEAGVTAPVEMTAVTTNITQYQQLAEVLQQNFKEIGINMTIKPGPPADGVQLFAVDKTAHGNINPYTGIPDPHGPIVRYLIPGALYNPGEKTPQDMLDKAYEAAGPVDPEKRAPIYAEFMDMWMKNPPHMMPICMVNSAAAFNDKVSNVAISVAGGTESRGVAVAKE